jgi:hypothetical protein
LGLFQAQRARTFKRFGAAIHMERFQEKWMPLFWFGNATNRHYETPFRISDKSRVYRLTGLGWMRTRER